MRRRESYRLANNFEKSSHLFRCRVSKGTAECWATWEIWLRLSFLALFELTGTSPALHTQGNQELPALATRRVPRIKVWDSSVLLAGRGTAINGRHQKQGVNFDGLGVMLPCFKDALGHGATESKVSLGTAWVTQWVGGCSQARPQICKGRACKPVPYTGILCSPCTCWVSENPVWPAQGSMSQGQKPRWLCGAKGRAEHCEAGGKSVDSVSPERWGCASAECEGLSLLPPPWLESSALLALFAAGKWACETSVRHLAPLRKAQLLSFRALTKPWAGFMVAARFIQI